jgi:hypothetical protein
MPITVKETSFDNSKLPELKHKNLHGLGHSFPYQSLLLPPPPEGAAGQSLAVAGGGGDCWSPRVLGTARVVSFMVWAWCDRRVPWRGSSPVCGGASRGHLERWLSGGRRGGWEARRRQRRSWRRPEAAARPALRGSLIASPRLDSRA